MSYFICAGPPINKHLIYILLRHGVLIKKEKQIMETHRDLDGHPLVDAVLVIEVDAVNAEPLEAALARCPHESWVAADLPFPIGEGDAELGGQLNLLPHPT